MQTIGTRVHLCTRELQAVWIGPLPVLFTSLPVHFLCCLPHFLFLQPCVDLWTALRQAIEQFTNADLLKIPEVSEDSGTCTVEPNYKDTPEIRTPLIKNTLPCPKYAFKFTPEMKTPLYTGRFTRSPRCPQ